MRKRRSFLGVGLKQMILHTVPDLGYYLVRTPVIAMQFLLCTNDYSVLLRSNGETAATALQNLSLILIDRISNVGPAKNSEAGTHSLEGVGFALGVLHE
jgi:hypothetical protein